MLIAGRHQGFNPSHTANELRQLLHDHGHIEWIEESIVDLAYPWSSHHGAVFIQRTAPLGHPRAFCATRNLSARTVGSGRTPVYARLCRRWDLRRAPAATPG
jgi:hypothetical protein